MISGDIKMTRYILFIVQPEGMHFSCAHVLLVVFSSSFHLLSLIFRFTSTLFCFMNIPCKNKNLFLFCVCNRFSFLYKDINDSYFSLLNTSPHIVSLFYNPSPIFGICFVLHQTFRLEIFFKSLRMSPGLSAHI